MLVQRTKRWVNSFKIKNVGEVPLPTKEEMEVKDEVAKWLIRYNFAVAVLNKEKEANQTKAQNSTKKKPPEWVEKSLNYINNKDNSLDELIPLIGEENVNNFVEIRNKDQVKNINIKKLDSESLKNLESYFN